MDQPRTQRSGHFGHDLARSCVDALGQLDFGLGIINGGIGGRVDDNIGLYLNDCRTQLIQIGQISAQAFTHLAIEGNQFAHRRERAL
ncbi:hypothetical protein D3C87_1571260 [compost metagenome]